MSSHNRPKPPNMGQTRAGNEHFRTRLAWPNSGRMGQLRPESAGFEPDLANLAERWLRPTSSDSRGAWQIMGFGGGNGDTMDPGDPMGARSHTPGVGGGLAHLHAAPRRDRRIRGAAGGLPLRRPRAGGHGRVRQALRRGARGELLGALEPLRRQDGQVEGASSKTRRGHHIGPNLSKFDQAWPGLHQLRAQFEQIWPHLHARTVPHSAKLGRSLPTLIGQHSVFAHLARFRYALAQHWRMSTEIGPQSAIWPNSSN